MTRTIVVAGTAVNLDDLVEGFDAGVEHESKLVAVIIAPAAYKRLRRLKRERDWAVIDRLRERNADKDPDRVFANVTAEIEEARRERRG